MRMPVAKILINRSIKMNEKFGDEIPTKSYVTVYDKVKISVTNLIYYDIQHNIRRRTYAGSKIR